MKRIPVGVISVCFAGVAIVFGQTAAPKQAGAPSQAKKTASITAPAKQGSAPRRNAVQSAQEVANQLAEAHRMWGTEMNSSALFSASLREVARNGSLYTFHLYTLGLPQNMLYNIVAWSVNQPRPVEVVKGVALDATGRAICPGQIGTCGTSTTPDAPTELGINVAPGRPVRVGLVSQDGSVGAYTKTVPMPIRGVDRGCTLEAVMLTAEGRAAIVTGTGFAPSSPIEMQITNGGERNAGKTTVDASGSYAATVIPVKVGATFGTMEVRVTSAKCSPSVSFDWGTKQPAGSSSPAAK